MRTPEQRHEETWVEVFAVAMLLSDAPVNLPMLREVAAAFYPSMRAMAPFRAARLVRLSFPDFRRAMKD
ncbi:MAG: hypothetical protein JWQ11_3491 [Rhizobacter sp.]|nr:hypothetical protein [Rhizobacter sp.]